MKINLDKEGYAFVPAPKVLPQDPWNSINLQEVEAINPETIRNFFLEFPGI